ncbi:hypothetical protein VTN77DRAFT_5525 [Rasamsonia byssochlamydoides]|uniref:uncharacterized protein n=1 Tax=Rasamsonia byssochlamydoides TaxID=89139 RepID=UPI0037440989
MESLSDTEWDIVISGTGLAQSLLALALSRSGKKVLHVDKNPYYGGPEAAFSLQEAEEWVDRLKKEPGQEPFEEVSIYSCPTSPDAEKKLSFSRAYTLSLSPYLIYSRSKLLPSLVSSKVYRQLEFQAVGSWWIYSGPTAAEDTPQSNADVSARLHRIPSSREDIFADDSISVKAKRMLIKFLRNISHNPQDGGDDSSASEEDLDLPFAEYLTSRFQVPSELHDPLLSLSLSQSSPQQTSARFAVPRIKRHLGSIGVFGPGFGSLLTKWGGGSEIAQVGCRALAVGGGVYVLNRDIQSVEVPDDGSQETFLRLKLSDGESIRSKFVVGSRWDLPAEAERPELVNAKVARCITIVSSSLKSLFPATAEGGPIPAGTVVVFPGKELSGGQGAEPPVYLLVHSSDTGECPDGQCVVYGSVSVPGDEGQSLLDAAVSKLLQTFAGSDDEPVVLWTLRYTQLGLSCEKDSPGASIWKSARSDRIVYFPPPSLDIAFDDRMIDAVKAAWKAVMGEEARDEEFMTFEDRGPSLDE